MNSSQTLCIVIVMQIQVFNNGPSKKSFRIRGVTMSCQTEHVRSPNSEPFGEKKQNRLQCHC